MVTVLQAVLRVPTHGLNMRPLICSYANLSPGGRNSELVEAFPQGLITYGPTFSIHISKTPSATATSEAKAHGLNVFQTITAAKLLGLERHDRAISPRRHARVSSILTTLHTRSVSGLRHQIDFGPL